MVQIDIHGVILTPLKKIENPKGDVYHALKNNDTGYAGFGEAYFSTVKAGEIKGWKKHKIMNMNLIVPAGTIKFVLYDGREESISNGQFMQITLSPINYLRLTVPPNIWMAFQGTGSPLNLLLNISDILHDPKESENILLNEIDYDWGTRFFNALSLE